MNVRVCVKKRNIPAIQSSSEQGGRGTRGLVGQTVFATSHSEFGGVSPLATFNVYNIYFDLIQLIPLRACLSVNESMDLVSLFPMR